MRLGPWQHQAAVVGSLLLWSLSVRSQHHKDFFPLDGSDYLGFLLAIGSLLVAAGGGIGGGALLVPIFIIIFGVLLWVHLQRCVPLPTIAVNQTGSQWSIWAMVLLTACQSCPVSVHCCCLAQPAPPCGPWSAPAKLRRPLS